MSTLPEKRCISIIAGDYVIPIEQPNVDEAYDTASCWSFFLTHNIPATCALKRLVDFYKLHEPLLLPECDRGRPVEESFITYPIELEKVFLILLIIHSLTQITTI